MGKATYVYCLVWDRRQPPLGRVPRGLPGAGRVRLLDADRGVWLAVADVPLARYGADAINTKLSDLDWVSRAAVAHEAVVEAFIGASAVVPMKLFTIFSTDERAVSHVAGDRRRIDRVLRRVAGKIELGVRVLVDPGWRPGPEDGGIAVRRSGAEYLRRKQAQRDASADRARRSSALAAHLFARLQKRAASARRRPASELPRREGPLVLDAAFLVPHRRVGAFRTAVAREARIAAEEGCRVTINGPWPPYSFVEE